MEKLTIQTPVNLQTGLDSAQVQQEPRNVVTIRHGQTVGQIIRNNIFTFFNLVNVILAGLVIATGSYKNMMFMGVVTLNILIGIIQQIRSKRVLDQLAFLHQDHASVVRSGQTLSIPLDQIVLNDILILESGNEIPCDGVVVQGSVLVNESPLTGESDSVDKHQGDSLYSGCYVTAGKCRMQVVRVGDETYTQKIMKEAGRVRRYPSQLRDSLNRIIQFSSVILFPLGALLFAKAFFIKHIAWQEAVLSAVAAMVGMIPEGLIILTSVALALASMKLARQKVLVQELYCIETLARVDMLCLDKTGTITEGTMKVDSVLVWSNEDVPAAHPSAEQEMALKQVIANVYHTLEDDNPTAKAMREFVSTIPANEKAVKVFPFSSVNKCAGAVFSQETILIGAYSFVFEKEDPRVLSVISDYASKGLRVLCVAKGPVMETLQKGDYQLLGLLVIQDVIRPDASKILSYFKKQDVQIRIISGDNPQTVAAIAKRVGVDGKWIDMASVSDDQIPEAVAQGTIFGRVTPEQKKLMVLALKKQGHTVAMTGDGVNDVMALKEADCSIAMGTGTQAARSVSSLVLLEDQFSALPSILNQGRQVINNIQRTASLFLVKTLFSVGLSLLTLFFLSAYPFEPIQLTLISGIGTGIPSFVLTLEPNQERITGHFLPNVLGNALPGALSMILIVIVLRIYNLFFPMDHDTFSALCTILAGINSLWILYGVCQPLTIMRCWLLGSMCVFFAGALVLFPGIFGMIMPNLGQWIFIVLATLCIPFVQRYLKSFGWQKMLMKWKFLQT